MIKTIYRINNQDGSFDIASELNPTIVQASFEDLDSCREYVDSLDVDHVIDVFHGSMVRDRFFADLEQKCDLKLQSCLAHANSHGWAFRRDVTYPSYKGEPSHYCYIGDFGVSASFAIDNKDIDNKDYDFIKQVSANAIRRDMAWLCACAETLWELGFVITFDDFGKHTIMSRCSSYFAEVEYEG